MSDYCPTSKEFVRSVQIEALRTGDYPRGTQIMYKPSHSKTEDDYEFGFITSYSPNGNVFCRFFHRTWSGVGSVTPSRTTANSESCRADDLTIHTSRPQEIVDELLRKIDNNESLYD
jgi:hypothetical protein